METDTAFAGKPYGSGYFGDRIENQFGLPAFRYTCNQLQDAKAVTPIPQTLGERHWQPLRAIFAIFVARTPHFGQRFAVRRFPLPGLRPSIREKAPTGRAGNDSARRVILPRTTDLGPVRQQAPRTARIWPGVRPRDSGWPGHAIELVSRRKSSRPASPRR